jgi:hypothetical protein
MISEKSRAAQVDTPQNSSRVVFRIASSSSHEKKNADHYSKPSNSNESVEQSKTKHYAQAMCNVDRNDNKARIERKNGELVIRRVRMFFFSLSPNLMAESNDAASMSGAVFGGDVESRSSDDSIHTQCHTHTDRHRQTQTRKVCVCAGLDLEEIARDCSSYSVIKT